MNKSLIVGLAVGAVAVTTVGAFAGYKMVAAPSSAEVVSVKALTKHSKTARKECHDEEVTRTKAPKDEHRLAGTGIGAVVGGLLGNRVGGGNGKVLATVAGAAAGGFAGNKIEEKMQQGNTYTTTEQHCDTVYDTHEAPAGYEVVYMLDGKREHVHMDHDPGKTIPVKDGHIVIDSDSNPSGSN